MYKKNKNKNEDFRIFKGKKKEFFLGTLFNFLIVGFFSFSIGCSEDGKFRLSNQAPHLSSRIDPLENSGADKEYSQLRQKKTVATATSGKLMPVQEKLGFNNLSPALSLNSIQNPFNVLEEAQHGGGTTNPETHLQGTDPCRVGEVNTIYNIIQRALGSTSFQGLNGVTANSLTYATGAYIASRFLECSKIDYFIGPLYGQAEVTQVGGRDLNTIESESDKSDRPEDGYKTNELAKWISDEDSGMIQSKMLFEQINNPVEIEGSSNKKYYTNEEGIQIFSTLPDDEERPFDKWVYFIQTHRNVEADSQDSADSLLAENSSVDAAQRTFLLEWSEQVASDADDEEADEVTEDEGQVKKYHIIGSMRYQYNQVMLTIGKFVEEGGGVVHQVHYGEKGTDFEFGRDCDLSRVTEAEKKTKTYYNAEGAVVSSGAALEELKEALGEDTVAELMKRLPNEDLKNFNLNLEGTVTKCGFPKAEIDKMHSEDITFVESFE